MRRPGRLKDLLKDRAGNMVLLAAAVCLGILMLMSGITEYMRLMITAAGVKDALQSAAVSVVNDNYDEVYHCVREGYAAGFLPESGSFKEALDYGDIYGRLVSLLGLTGDGSIYVCENADGGEEYRILGLQASVTGGDIRAGSELFYVKAVLLLEVPVQFMGKTVFWMRLPLETGAAWQERFIPV